MVRVGGAIVVDRLGSVPTEPTKMDVYDRAIGVRLLYEDPATGVEHDLIRYPAGLGARVHRHTAAHTIVVLEGRLQANDRIVGPGAYCHFPAGEPMFHAPAGDDDCLFVIVFHGPDDVTRTRDPHLGKGGAADALLLPSRPQARPHHHPAWPPHPPATKTAKVEIPTKQR